MSEKPAAHKLSVGLLMHPDRPRAKELAESARTWWETRGHHVVDLSGAEAGQVGPLDFAVSLGGDGTVLRTVQLAIEQRAAVLGVNLGQLGYLTEIEPSGIQTSFERLVSGDYQIEERMTLQVVVHNSNGRHECRALNDAVVGRTSPGHTVRVQISIGETPFLTVTADGVLVATPTGSTAYTFSLGGPILTPDLKALVMTPIAPHMLFDRTLVLDPRERVGLQLIDERNGVVMIDGLISFDVQPGDLVEITSGRDAARFVRFEERDFYKVLRTKFNLADR